MFVKSIEGDITTDRDARRLQKFNIPIVVINTEGDDKPAKYPLLFREAKAVVLNKVDLIPYTNFNYNSFMYDLSRIKQGMPFFKISCTKNNGLDEWYKWISDQRFLLMDD